MSKQEKQVIECPSCSGELDYDKVMLALETKGSFKCTHCGSLIEADDSSEEAEDTSKEEVETDLEDPQEEESSEEVDESDAEESDESEAETETEEEEMSTSQEVAKAATAKPTAATAKPAADLPKGEKTVGGSDKATTKATKANGATHAIDHEAIIADVRKKLTSDTTVGERVHETYVSFYKNEKGTARGKRFMVIYRNGRNIKAQFFGIEKVANPNVRDLETEADAFEYKGKDTADFQKYLEQVF